MKTGTIDGQENPLSILNAAKLVRGQREQVVLTAAHAAAGVHQHRNSGLEQAHAPAAEDVALRETAANARRQEATTRARLADEKTVLVPRWSARGLTVIDTPDLAAFRANADKVYAEADMAPRPGTRPC